MLDCVQKKILTEDILGFFFLGSVLASFRKPWLPPAPIQANELIIIHDEEEDSNDRDEVDLTTNEENIQHTFIAKKRIELIMEEMGRAIESPRAHRVGYKYKQPNGSSSWLAF